MKERKFETLLVSRLNLQAEVIIKSSLREIDRTDLMNSASL